MAKAKVTLICPQCGEEFKVETTKYNRKDADKWAIWAKEQNWICRDCEKANWEAKKDAENKAAAEATIEMGLPALTGSEKQIAWANTIRMNFLTKAKKVRGLNDRGLEAVDSIASEYKEAKFWIDHRNSFEYSVADIRGLAELLSRKWVPKALADE